MTEMNQAVMMSSRLSFISVKSNRLSRKWVCLLGENPVLVPEHLPMHALKINNSHFQF
jgi:hypothetical protein